ncbi:purine-binding chemotaxis protein CheW [Marinospirillum celere]|uniref:Chemotaxis protein CheW n=1 Tax=Marinospirillum celere TaxID=1122252 RepID=A0A1I1EDU5_9GAMM|nr:chemotaxis protein CheW [Marinospirillum celere]SFB84762.1 purine-binding chemotaxis protein CheW [Marinospirillum celere]
MSDALDDQALVNSGQQEFLTFTLGEEEYAIDILKVQEIRGYDGVTRIANTPSYIKGVINMRGVIVPVVDMRIKFNVGEVVYDQFTVMIILNLGERIVGMVVDGVSDVIALDPEQIRPAPEFGATLDTEYLQGLATLAKDQEGNQERMAIVVDIEKLMTSGDMGLMDQVVQAG